MKLRLDYISDRMKTKKIVEEKNIVNKQRYDNIKLLFKLTDEEINHKKEMGIKYLEKEHNWEFTTKKMINLYENVIRNI